MSPLMSSSWASRWVARLSYWSLGWNVNKSRMNTWMSAQHGWKSRTLGSELPVGITTATTTIINPIIFNHNLGRASWWVRRCARLEHQGEWRGNLGSKPSPVVIDTSTMRVEPWSKATGTGSLWSGYWDLRRTVESYRPSCEWAISERRRMTWKVIGWLLIIYQVNRIIVDAGVLGYHRHGIRREEIGVIRILGGARDGDLFNV